MKIIQVITSFDMGGAERVAINLSQSVTPNYKYYLIEVVKGNSVFTNQLKEELKNYNISFFCSPFKNKKIALCLFWMEKSEYAVTANDLKNKSDIPILLFLACTGYQ